MQIPRGREFPTEGRASTKALVFKEQGDQRGWNRLSFAKGRRGQREVGLLPNF